MNLSDVVSDVNEYTEEALYGYKVAHVGEKKVIRDAVYGFHRFYPHEIALIDSPIVQRLRDVHQTALAYLVYPSANHTRFEHSLGVATKAERMAQALRSAPSKTVVSERELLELRMAGLLHDVGHGLFSHLTEAVLAERHASVVDEIRRSNAYAEKTNLGEALSAMIVRSDAFGSLLDEVKNRYTDTPGIKEIHAERIADLILGTASDPKKQYLADIISGPFDADKLDYLGRDSHFTGLSAEVDWERIVHELDVCEKDGFLYLAVWSGAVPQLEQVLFSKMMMHSAVYHHHKIRALEQMVRVVFEVAHSNRSKLIEETFALSRVSDIWRLSEAEFFALGLREPELREYVAMIHDRRLMQRALSLNITTITDSSNEDNRMRFQSLFADTGDTDEVEDVKDLQDAVWSRLGNDVKMGLDKRLIRFDFPRSPRLSNDAEQCNVLVSKDDVRTLKPFFPIEDWTASYSDNKLTGHVFSIGDRNAREAVADAGGEVLKEAYEIELDASARIGLKGKLVRGLT